MGELRRWCRTSLVVALAALIVGVLPAIARAQIDAGTVSGIITDDTGGTLPGVSITVTNLGSGITRTTTTDGDGRYVVPALQPGKYSVSAELQAFATVIRPEITVNVGSVADISIQMKVASIEETLTVYAAAPLVEAAKTDLSTVITGEVLQSIPTRNRDYLDLTLLQGGTSENVSSNNGTGAAVGGARSKEGALLVDGFYNLDISFIQPKQRHSQDLVQEFQVVTFGGSAEYGRAIGGITNVVTKSGGNDVHGSGYGYFRDTKLNSPDFSTVRAGAEKPPYDRKQWGSTFGGPIMRNKAFYMTSFEILDENLPTQTGIRADDIAAIGLPATAALMPRAMKSRFVFGKVDYNISSNQRVQFTSSFNHQIETTSWNFSLTTRSRWYQLVPDDYVFAGKWQRNSTDGRRLDELKVNYFPRFYIVNSPLEAGSPLCACTLNATYPNPPGAAPRVNITGVASFGSGGLQDFFNTYPIQTIYTSSSYRNDHSFKFGVDWLYAKVDYERSDPLLGTYTFASLAAYKTGTYSQYVQQFGDTRLPRTYQMGSVFWQDSWAAHPRLTVNYGIRWDIDVPVKHWRTGTPYGKTDYNNFGPRFALSYDMTGEKSTFFKFTSGVYYDRIWGNDTNNMFTFKDDPIRVSATWRPTDPGAPVYPNTFATKPATIPAGISDAIIMPTDANIPTSAQAVFTFEHMFGGNTAFTASGIYTKSWFKQFTIDTNLLWNPALNNGAGGYGRVDPAYRRITQLQLAAPAQYQGVIVELEKRGSRMGVSTNLTLSKSEGIESINDLHTYQVEGFSADLGPQPDSPAARATLSGYINISKQLQLSGAFRARTGTPINASASGVDLNGDGVLGDRTPGVEPFSFRTPPTNSVDLRLTYNLPLGGERKVALMLEGYNVLNHENIRTVLNDYGSVLGTPKSRWLEPALFFPPREIQIGVRFGF